jgi:hypothetical protein
VLCSLFFVSYKNTDFTRVDKFIVSISFWRRFLVLIIVVLAPLYSDIIDTWDYSSKNSFWINLYPIDLKFIIRFVPYIAISYYNFVPKLN